MQRNKKGVIYPPVTRKKKRIFSCGRKPLGKLGVFQEEEIEISFFSTLLSE